MASPTSRATLAEYCLRRLGDPVIEVNVDPDQIEDKIDDALQLYQEFHSDATLRTYIAHQVTSTDLANGYITLDSNILFVTQLFPISAAFGSSRNFFDIKYQLMLNDITNLYNYLGDLAYYDQIQQYLSLLQMTLNGTPTVQFSVKQNRLYIWGDLVDGDVREGDYIVAEVYIVVNPNTFSAVYNDMFVKDYTTSLIKQQWGMNLLKFEGMQLPGGVTLNGRQIYEDATQELETLRERMRLEHEMPADFFCG